MALGMYVYLFHYLCCCYFNIDFICKRPIVPVTEGFVEGIRTDGTTRERMPRDGTVFQLTSNVMRYLE